MTNEQAKALGERALALGMPWARGLMDGGYGYPIIQVDGRLTNSIYLSWPDFRDPVTEAWLVAWCGDEAQKHSNNAFIARLTPLTNGKSALVVWRYSSTRGDNWAQSTNRAEAWILALEKLKGEG